MGRRRRDKVVAGVTAIALVAVAVAVVLVARSGGDDAPAASRTPVPSEPLPQLAARRNVAIGAGVNDRRLLDTGYADLVARSFTSITGQNAFKWQFTEPGPGRFTFTATDRVVTFAERHHLRVRGHTLIWHRQNPQWLTTRTWTRPALMAVMKRHIQTVVGRYRGRVAQWDVVNEAIDEHTNQLRQSIWERVIGPDYIALAFRWTHEADPSAQLFYNDFGLEVPGPHLHAVYDMVQNLRAQGVPINGVGLQAHRTLDRPTARNISASMGRFASLGVDVELTELDIPLAQPASAGPLMQQGQVYAAMVAVCLAIRRCTGVTVWGADDNDLSPDLRARNLGSATLFDQLGQPKPAYDGVARALTYAKGPRAPASPGSA